MEQIWHYYEKGQKAVVLEDLVSTGKSSLQVVDVLRQAGIEVVGMVSIFSYGFPEAVANFEQAGVKLLPLTRYETHIRIAMEQQLVNPAEEEVLLQWNRNPAEWNPHPQKKDASESV